MKNNMLLLVASVSVFMFCNSVSAADTPKTTGTSASAKVTATTTSATTSANTAKTSLDSAAIKKNMLERKPKITALKKAGIIGENKAGYLEVIKDAKISEADTKILDGENADRKLVYAAIAKKEGSTVDNVSSLRAKKIRTTAKEGEMIQGEDGKWIKAPAQKAESKSSK